MRVITEASITVEGVMIVLNRLYWLNNCTSTTDLAAVDFLTSSGENKPFRSSDCDVLLLYRQ